MANGKKKNGNGNGGKRDTGNQLDAVPLSPDDIKTLEAAAGASTAAPPATVRSTSEWEGSTHDLDITSLGRRVTAGIAAKRGRKRLLDIATLMSSTLLSIHTRLISLNERHHEWEDVVDDVASDLHAAYIPLATLMESRLPKADA